MKRGEPRIESPQDIKTALSVRRGRTPVTPEGINRRARMQQLATVALTRIQRIAKNKELAARNPKLILEANQWLYEIHYGKPKVQIDATVTGRIGVFPDEFRLIDEAISLDDDIECMDYRVVSEPEDSTLHNNYSANTDTKTGDGTEFDDTTPDNIDT